MTPKSKLRPSKACIHVWKLCAYTQSVAFYKCGSCGDIKTVSAHKRKRKIKAVKRGKK